MLQYFDLDHSVIHAAAERNPDKWGKVTVGTRIPIISESEARAAKPDYFLVSPGISSRSLRRASMTTCLRPEDLSCHFRNLS